MGKWYRSKERKSGESPFASNMLNKKWTLEEEFNNHILRFQQVNVSGGISTIGVYGGVAAMSRLRKAEPVKLLRETDHKS